MSSSAPCRKKEAIQRCLKGFSVEITPRQAKRVPSFEGLPGLRIGTRVYVTSLPRSDPADCIKTCERLKAAGLRPVAHVPARAFPSLAALECHLARLRGDAGVEDVLALAGAGPVIGDGGRGNGRSRRQDGPLFDSLQLLNSGLLLGRGFRSVAVAGHPEGHPTVPAALLDDAILRKAQWWWQALLEKAELDEPVPSLHFETQFCFDAAPVVSWEQRQRRRLETARQAGRLDTLPMPSIRVGLAGPAKLSDLLRFAEISGVGASALHQLTSKKRAAALSSENDSDNSSSNAETAAALFPAAPDGVIAGLADDLQDNSSSLISGVHFYSFGGFARTLRWASAVERGEFDLRPNDLGGGFEVRF
jgi:methylenetetrahydrofolate reductase (NADPH)